MTSVVTGFKPSSLAKPSFLCRCVANAVIGQPLNRFEWLDVRSELILYSLNHLVSNQYRINPLVSATQLMISLS